MTSIWSRSTASTTSSSKEQKHARKEGEQFGSHHFGALIGMLPPSEETVEKPLPEAEAQLPTGETFQDFASEDEFEECETMSHSSSLSVCLVVLCGCKLFFQNACLISLSFF